jgi:hypothetical protein
MEVSFLAGLWVGEGWCSIERSMNKCTGRYGYGARAGISNCDRGLLEVVQQNYGGLIIEMSRKAGWRQAYNIRWGSTRAYEMMALLSPHILGEKKARADLFVEYGKVCWRSCGTNGQRPRTAEELRLQDDYYQQMKTLNTRGENVA